MEIGRLNSDLSKFGKNLWDLVVCVALGLCLTISSEVFASAGCNQVNSGAWNASLNSFSNGVTIGGFENGDRINFVVSGFGQFSLLGSSGGAYVDLLDISPPGSGSYTVTAPYTTFRTLNDSVSSPLDIIATCTPATQISISDQRLIAKSFLLSRINSILLSDPGSSSLENRNNSSSNVGTSFKMIADALQFSYKASPVPFAYRGAQLPLQFWLEGSYSGFNDNSANLSRDGHVDVLYVGGDYRINSDMLAGLLVQFDWSKDTSDQFSSKVSGKGWLAGPYVSTRIYKNIFLDLRAELGRSSNDMTIGTTTGDYDTSRWLIKGDLYGSWRQDCWRITPLAELAYMAENQDGFTNSVGDYVAGQDVALGRLQFGPEVGYSSIRTGNVWIEPFAALLGVWDFYNPDVAIIDGVVVGPGNFWGRLQGGLIARITNGMLVRGLVSWDSIGASNYNGYTLQCTLIVPLY